MSGKYDDDEGMGTPKAPKLPLYGRPDRPCPGAPSKGKAPRSFFDLSDDAPVRRLNFADSSESPDGPPVSYVFEEMAGSPVHSPSNAEQLQVEQWARCPPLQQSWHPQQQWPQNQVQQQPLQQPEQQQQYQQQTLQSQQQQLGVPGNSIQMHQQQHWLHPSGRTAQQQLQQPEQRQQNQQQTLQSQQQQLGASWSSSQLHQQQHWLHPSGSTAQQQQQVQLWNPLSPSASHRVLQQQNSSTPARLFR